MTITAGAIIRASDTGGLLPAWVAWTPTLTSMTLGNGTVVAAYRAVGKTLDYRFRFILGSTSAMGSDPRFTLPFAPHSFYGVSNDPMGDGFLTEAGVSQRRGAVALSTGSTVRVLGYNTGIAVTITATSPFTWGTGDTLSVAGTIELA